MLRQYLFSNNNYTLEFLLVKISMGILFMISNALLDASYISIRTYFLELEAVREELVHVHYLFLLLCPYVFHTNVLSNHISPTVNKA
jgi:hypothetical protein